MTAILVTGLAGFAGSHICDDILSSTDWDIVGLDRLTYAGSLERLSQHQGNPRLRMVFHDFRAEFPPSVLHLLDGVRYIVHNGAETHVDRSFTDPESFVMSNVLGTMRVLDAARKLQPERFLYVGTDEVHGPAPEGVSFREDAEILPSNPYSASKAGAEALCYAWWKSFRVPILRTRTMNLYGEKQHPEKFVPMCISKIANGETVTVHGNQQVIGARKWLHARNQAHALRFILNHGQVGDTYHIAGEELTNLEMAQHIALAVGEPLHYELVDFHAARLGHDRRYSLDDSKLRALGWHPPLSLDTSLARTVDWCLQRDNLRWLEPDLTPTIK